MFPGQVVSSTPTLPPSSRIHLSDLPRVRPAAWQSEMIGKDHDSSNRGLIALRSRVMIDGVVSSRARHFDTVKEHCLSHMILARVSVSQLYPDREWSRRPMTSGNREQRAGGLAHATDMVIEDPNIASFILANISMGKEPFAKVYSVTCVGLYGFPQAW